MTRFNEAILAAAGEYLGLAEWPGAKNNPEITNMFRDVGHGNVVDDETPWCAAFVGSVLSSLGLPHTGKLNARSYLEYSAEVGTQDARPGDIVVLWRGSPKSWQGHVGFFVRYEGSNVILRGGNQGNKVSDAAYSMDRILSVRRADGVEDSGKRPTLRLGSRGAFVYDVQTQLTNLGYKPGDIDGEYGADTVAAVSAFQARNDLIIDGVTGPRTWKALASASPRPKRNKSEADLKESRTIQTAEKSIGVSAVVGAVGVGGAAMSAAEEAYSVVERAGTLVEAVLSASPWLIVMGVVAIGGFLLWKNLNAIKRFRVEDAQTGANMKR